MAILGTPIIDIWCERKLNEDGTHSAILNWNPKYAKVFIYRKKDGNSWEQTPIIVTNSNTYDMPISSDIDLSNVTDLIEDIDTTIVEANTQDILIKLGQQQEQINDINNKLDLILSKL